MKLIEILARELKEWPSQYESIIQDEGGHLHGCYSISGDDTDQEDLPFDPVEVAWDGAKVQVTRAEWQAAVDALNKHAEKAWNGEGRPPIGVEIECSYPMWGYWLKGKVLCYGEQMIFMEQESSKGNGKFEGSMNPDGIMFRPIRTPEQIAADKRLHKVRNAATAIARTLDSLHESEEFIAVTVIEAMIDAGYVKQVAP